MYSISGTRISVNSWTDMAENNLLEQEICSFSVWNIVPPSSPKVNIVCFPFDLLIDWIVHNYVFFLQIRFRFLFNVCWYGRKIRISSTFDGSLQTSYASGIAGRKTWGEMGFKIEDVLGITLYRKFFPISLMMMYNFYFCTNRFRSLT